MTNKPANAVEEFRRATGAAMLARWLMEQRERTVLAQDTAVFPADTSGNGAASASDNLLADRFVPPHVSRARS